MLSPRRTAHFAGSAATIGPRADLIVPYGVRRVITLSCVNN
jgi:hypothetical protein